MDSDIISFLKGIIYVPKVPFKAIKSENCFQQIKHQR